MTSFGSKKEGMQCRKNRWQKGIKIIVIGTRSSAHIENTTFLRTTVETPVDASTKSKGSGLSE